MVSFNLGVRLFGCSVLGDGPMFQPSLTSEIVSLLELQWAGFSIAFRANGLVVAIGHGRILHLLPDSYRRWVIIAEISLLFPEIDS